MAKERGNRMRNAAFQGLIIAAALTATALVQAQAQPEEGADESADEQTAEPSDAAPSSAEAPAAPAAPAAAQEASATEKSGAAAPAADTSRAGADGARFRFGVSGGAGFFTARPEIGTEKLSFTYGGVDLRLGAQINDLLGIYAQPTLGYYAGDTGVLAVGGLLGVAAGADVTFVDRVFVGAGIGYTVYNNPAGISPLFRVGVYPLVSRSDEKIRRKGLMLGLDLRVTKLDGLKSIVMPTFNIGYEAF